MITELLQELNCAGVPVCRFEIMAKTVDITVLWVPQSMRNKGIGSATLINAIADIRMQTLKPITLSVVPFDGAKMANLVDFYTRHGFVVTHYSEDCVEMTYVDI